MIIILLIILIWLILGLTPVFFTVREEYRKGSDISIRDLMYAFVATCCGPFAMFMWIKELYEDNADKVIIKAKKKDDNQ